MFKKRLFSPKLLAIVFLNLFLIASPLIFVLAQGAGLGTGAGLGDKLEIPNPLRANTFTQLFFGIYSWVAGLVALVAVLMIIYGGIQYMISGGNEEKIATARKTIQWSLIGLIIVVMSWGILKAILEILGVK